LRFLPRLNQAPALTLQPVLRTPSRLRLQIVRGYPYVDGVICHPIPIPVLIPQFYPSSLALHSIDAIADSQFGHSIHNHIPQDIEDIQRDKSSFKLPNVISDDGRGRHRGLSRVQRGRGDVG